MPRATRAQSYFPIKIPVYTLSGGVGRQIPSKRLPSECDALTNFFCTTQSSLDKRNGTEWVGNLGTIDTYSSGVDQLYYSWTEVDAVTSILLVIDAGIDVVYTSGFDDEPYFETPVGAYTAYKIVASERIGNTVITTIPTVLDGVSTMDWKTYRYLIWNPDNIPARDRLRTVNIGSATLILNKEVTAGFTSLNGNIVKNRFDDTILWEDPDGDAYYKNMDGSVPYARQKEWNLDFEGADITYLTSIAVDRKHASEVWVESQDYTWSSKAIDLADPIIDVSEAPETGYPWNSFAGIKWNETIIPHRGGMLEFDISSAVKAWEPNEFEAAGAFLSNRELGCQITLKGLDTSTGTSQTFNYLWLKKNGGNLSTLGEEFYWTTNGAPEGTSGTGPERARTIAVNTYNASATKASASIDFSSASNSHVDGYQHRYPLYLGNGTSGSQTNQDVDNATSGSGYHGNKWEEAGYYAQYLNYPGQMVDNREVEYDDNALAFLELTDVAGRTVRYYTGLLNEDHSGGGGWAHWDKANSNFPDVPDHVDKVMIWDAWTDRHRACKNLKGAIESANGHNGSITCHIEDSKILHMLQNTTGSVGNSTIIFNWNDHLLNNNYNAAWKCNGSGDGVDENGNFIGFSFSGGNDASELEYSDEERASGHADADALVRAVNQWQPNTLTAKSNQFSLDDTTYYAGRVIITQNSEGSGTNTSVWTNDYTERVMDDSIEDTPPVFDHEIDWNLNLFCSESIPNSFKQGTSASGSINDTISQTWDDIDPADGEGCIINYWASGLPDDPWELPFFLVNDDYTNALRFGIWQVRDYLPADELPGPTNVLLASDEDRVGSQLPPHKDKARWKRVESDESDLLDGAGGNKLNVATSRFMPVEDYVYPNSSYLYLGQSFKQFTDMKFPPDRSDLVAFNGGDLVEDVFTRLYDEDSDSDTYGRNGKGKIMYLSQAYLQHTPGWYRITRKEKAPYMDKVRTPGKRTSIDKYRMPQIIFSETREDEDLSYYATPVEWDRRQSGDEESNRGPGIFYNPSDDKPKESKISAMAFYRDRLFLANEDTIIASRAGDWDNFFLSNPDNIINSDPLDLMISSNNYTPITYLIPFRDFLFVGTSGNTQYEMTGSNNIISPLTAEFAPTAFYPMMPDVPPVPMNNNLFFYSKGQLFIYFGQRDLATEQAFEVSKHVPNYLPDKLDANASSSFGSMLFGLKKGVDSTSPSKIYCYRNQIAGEKVVQNAFFDWTFFSEPWGDQVEDIRSWDKYLYLIQSSEWYTNSVTPQPAKMWLSRIKLDKHDINIPRLDGLRRINDADQPGIFLISGDVSYNSSTNKTQFTFTHFDENFVFDPPFWNYLVSENGDIVSVTRVVSDDDGNILYNVYEAEGNYDYFITNVRSFAESIRYAGRNFTSSVVLSPIYLRDDANNIVPGTLNLRSGLVQTYDSKAFDVEVSVNNRSKKTLNFVHDTADDRWEDDYIGASTLTGELSEHQVKFPILGFAQDVKITVSSDNPHPLNIASLQFTGKFKPITRYHNS